MVKCTTSLLAVDNKFDFGYTGKKYLNEKIKMSKKLFLFTSLVFIYFFSFSQVNDFAIWTGAAVKHKINSNLDVQVKGQLRFNENVTELGALYAQADGEYSLSNSFSVGLAYRFERKRRTDDFYGSRHRINLNASYKVESGNFDVSLRERFQTQYSDVNSSKDGKIADYYLRSKLTTKYKISKSADGYVSGELWYALNNGGNKQFDNVRYSGGLEYQLNGRNGIELFFLIDKEFNVRHPSANYVAGIMYSYSL